MHTDLLWEWMKTETKVYGTAKIHYKKLLYLELFS